MNDFINMYIEFDYGTQISGSCLLLFLFLLCCACKPLVVSLPSLCPGLLRVHIRAGQTKSDRLSTSGTRSPFEYHRVTQLSSSLQICSICFIVGFQCFVAPIHS